MGTILLTWNPAKEGPDTYQFSDEWPEVVLANLAGKEYSATWSVGRHRNGIGAGDIAYFLLQGAGHRGIVARAEVQTAPEEGDSFEDPTKRLNYVDVQILESVLLEESLPTEVLMSIVPGVPWHGIYQSGRIVDDASAALLDQYWFDHLEGLAADVAPGEETEYVEGAVTTVLVNRYERDPAARAACLKHHGAVCASCGLHPVKKFGDLGARVLVVHHLTPISKHKKLHAVDPVNDMRPLCSNCHAMVHSQDPPLHPDDLRAALSRK